MKWETSKYQRAIFTASFPSRWSSSLQAWRKLGDCSSRVLSPLLCSCPSCPADGQQQHHHHVCFPVSVICATGGTNHWLFCSSAENTNLEVLTGQTNSLLSLNLVSHTRWTIKCITVCIDALVLNVPQLQISTWTGCFTLIKENTTNGLLVFLSFIQMWMTANTNAVRQATYWSKWDPKGLRITKRGS